MTTYHRLNAYQSRKRAEAKALTRWKQEWNSMKEEAYAALEPLLASDAYIVWANAQVVGTDTSLGIVESAMRRMARHQPGKFLLLRNSILRGEAVA